MPGSTTRFAIPKPSGTDPVADGDDTMRALADRVDYCLGENGEDSITPSAANTKTTKTINFGRTYKSPPRVVVGLGGDNYSVSIGAGALTLWVDDVTNSSFTLAINAASTLARQVTWMARPKNTDVTP